MARIDRTHALPLLVPFTSRLYGTFTVVKDTVPNTTKPNQHLLEMQLPLITCGQKHPVSGYGYMTDVPVVNEMVGLWASVGHDGSAKSKLELYITSVERFPWKDTEGELATHGEGHTCLLIHLQMSIIWTLSRTGSSRCSSCKALSKPTPWITPL